MFGHKYGNLHIFHGVCLLVDHSSLAGNGGQLTHGAFCVEKLCKLRLRTELRTFYIILLNLSLGELESPADFFVFPIFLMDFMVIFMD